MCHSDTVKPVRGSSRRAAGLLLLHKTPVSPTHTMLRRGSDAGARRDPGARGLRAKTPTTAAPRGLPVAAGPGTAARPPASATRCSSAPEAADPPERPRAPVSKTLSASRQILPKSFAEHGLSACPKPIDKLKHLPSGIIPLKLGEAHVGANFIFC